METLTIPPPDDIRQQIRERIIEVRALRKMLQLAEAAQTVAESRARRQPIPAHGKGGAQ